MAKRDQIEIRVRLVIDNPAAGVFYSLQDKKNAPVDRHRAQAGERLTFEFPVRVGPGPKFFGEQVRSEGPERRFVYIASGRQAGDLASCWDRRMKIDIHTIPRLILDKALAIGLIEGHVPGTGSDGGPACATIPASWRAGRD